MKHINYKLIYYIQINFLPILIYHLNSLKRFPPTEFIVFRLLIFFILSNVTAFINFGILFLTFIRPYCLRL